MIPTEKLREILEKAGKATPGPWLFRSKSGSVHRASGTHPFGEHIFAFCEEASPIDADIEHIVACDPTTISSIIRELLAWREFYADLVEHCQEALCLVCAEHMKDELPDSVRRYVDLDAEALARIEEAGKGE